jgi:serine/threonine protein kinase
MAPTLSATTELDYLAETFGPGKDGECTDFLYTSFTWFDADDHAYFGLIRKPKLKISLEEFSSALELIPDDEIYPLLSDAEAPPRRAPESINMAAGADLKDIYIKRPPVKEYDSYKEDDILNTIPAMMLEEVAAFQHISKHEQHPNVVRFFGCRTRRDRITGLMMPRYEYSLREFVKAGKTVDKERILNGLQSAIQYLHSLGLAHNDINPSNIMVDEESGEPVLVDFGSSHRLGSKLTFSRGTPGWTEEGDDYILSKESHDISALEKIRLWLDNPVFR